MSGQTDLLQDPAALRSFARRVEDWGYGEVYVPDHFGSVDPFVPLVVVAEATTSLRVGSLVVNNEFHYPAMLARTAATLDRLSGGRFVLGLGTGYMESEHHATGIELRPPGERVPNRGRKTGRALGQQLGCYDERVWMRSWAKASDDV